MDGLLFYFGQWLCKLWRFANIFFFVTKIRWYGNSNWILMCIFFSKAQKTYLSPSIREVLIWGTQPSDGGWMAPHEWQRLRWEDWKTGRREWWYPGFRWRPGKWNVSKPWWWEDKSFIDYMSTGYVLRRKVGEGGSFIWKIAILTKRKVLVLKLLLILDKY